MSTPPSEMTSSKSVVDSVNKGKARHVLPAATKKTLCFGPIPLHKGEGQPAWTLW